MLNPPILVRDEYNIQFGEGSAPLILARTDALKTDGFEAAIQRCLAFRKVGCDMTFLEAPESIEHMREYCRRVDGPKLANMLEQGSTPILPPEQLKQMGYTMAAYPLTLLSASIKAMTIALERIRDGSSTDDIISTCKGFLASSAGAASQEHAQLRLFRCLTLVVSCLFCRLTPTEFFCIVVETKDAVGFTRYSLEEDQYKTS